MNPTDRNIKINHELYGDIRTEGMLYKYPVNKPIKPGQGDRLFKHRYFVLADNLVYYEDEQAFKTKRNKPKGVICLDFAAISLHSTDKTKIALRTPKKMLILRCQSEQEALHWMEAMKLAQQ